MIIKQFAIDKYADSNFGIFLFYGKNEGLQNEVLQDKFLNNLREQYANMMKLNF